MVLDSATRDAVVNDGSDGRLTGVVMAPALFFKRIDKRLCNSVRLAPFLLLFNLILIYVFAIGHKLTQLSYIIINFVASYS